MSAIIKNLFPVGAVIDFMGGTVPDGWLLCYGQSLDRTDYDRLFDIIGVEFGSVDGSHFNLPDLRGRACLGADDMGGSAANRITTAGCGLDGTDFGASGGAQSHTLTTAQMGNHYHQGGGIVGGNGIAWNAANYYSQTLNTAAAGGGAAHNNMQPSLVTDKIIKV